MKRDEKVLRKRNNRKRTENENEENEENEERKMKTDFFFVFLSKC